MPLVSLQSVNYNNRYVRHINFLGELTPIQSDQDRQDATFNLKAYNETVQLVPINFPNFVLRHQEFRIKITEVTPSDNPGLLVADSTFLLTPSASGRGATLMFRSSNFKDRFIRHLNFDLWLETPDNEHESDAIFLITDPLYIP
jgi:hypothetical protein